MENIVRQNEQSETTTERVAGRSNHRTQVRIARGLDDLLMVYTIRASVYMAEQNCPFVEEFDGNDHCATHFIGFIGGEPAGCLRARFFSDFVKLERLAVRKNFRRSTLAFDLVREGIDFTRRKGFTRVYGHSREGLESFWARFGAKPILDREQFAFSDYRYTEMVIDLEPTTDSISLKSQPMVILRPEGDWDRPGVLEISSARQPCRPTENSVTTR
jgi:predicted GNAT family N-acyltransferase